MGHQSKANRPPQQKCPKCGAPSRLFPAALLGTTLCEECHGAYRRAIQAEVGWRFGEAGTLRTALDGTDATIGRRVLDFFRKIRTLGWLL